MGLQETIAKAIAKELESRDYFTARAAECDERIAALQAINAPDVESALGTLQGAGIAELKFKVSDPVAVTK